MKNEKVILTKHACERAKERFSWKKKTLKRMAKKALNCGLTVKDVDGDLQLHLKAMNIGPKHVANTRVYGDNAYIFVNNRLVTLFRLENGYVKSLKDNVNETI